MNLTYETREGYVKNYVTGAGVLTPGDAVPHHGRPGRPRSGLGFAANEMPTLEVQLVGHADEIAYDTHDLDDGLVSGTLQENAVRAIPLWRRAEEQVVAEYELLGSDQRLRWRAVVRRLISILVGDLLAETRRRLVSAKIHSAAEARHCAEELIGFSAEIAPQKFELETFLMDNFYQHPRVKEKTTLWQGRLKALFAAFRADPNLIPEEHRRRLSSGTDSADRVICDYLAGMTDRFAARQWEDMTGGKA